MYFLLIGLIIIAALLLCFVVMIQNSKGGGLASSFASSNQIMGVRKTTDFLEKATWTLAATIVILSIASAAFVTTSTEKSSVVQKNIEETVIPELINNGETEAVANPEIPTDAQN